MVVSNPPGGQFGPSPRTQMLRPDCGMDEWQVGEARRLRKEGVEIQDIAEQLGVAIEEVQVAIAPMRTPVPHHTRRTVNVGVAAYRAIMAEKQQGEAVWQTMDRLLTELHNLRNFAAQVRNDPR